jgi:gamma-carbonic anhydrase
VLLEHEGRRPAISPSAYVAPTAVVVGDVTVGEDARILFGAVVTDDGGPVTIGRRSMVLEHALVRGREGHPVRIGEHVLVGPSAYVNGAEIADEAFIATGASVFPGARIGAQAEVQINGVVHVNTALPPSTVVPIGWVAVGNPCQILPPKDHDRIWSIQKSLDFPGTVLGVPRAPDGNTPMTEAMDRYAELFGRHRADRILPENEG